MGGSDRALVIDIKGNSLDDGPGIRSVVFFKGCPLSCAWCHNPESISRHAQLSWDASLCTGCGTCAAACVEAAIEPQSESRIDRTRCKRCFSCTEGCPSKALRRVGAAMSVQQVARQVLRDKAFYDASGGGVTLSGGEPTLHMDFVAELARALRDQGVHMLLETCGLFRLEDFTALLLPHLDAVYMDLKLIDPVEHRRWCGVDNRRILENFAALSGLARGGAFALTARTPLIPGVTDTEHNLAGIGRFLAGLGVEELQLLPNNPTWQEKSRALDVQARQALPEATRHFLSDDEVARCRELVAAQGVYASAA